MTGVCALLAGQLVNLQGNRAGLIGLLIVVRHVHVALCVACVVRHPQRHWSSCYGNLETNGKTSSTITNHAVRVFLKLSWPLCILAAPNGSKRTQKFNFADFNTQKTCQKAACTAHSNQPICNASYQRVPKRRKREKI